MLCSSPRRGLFPKHHCSGWNAGEDDSAALGARGAPTLSPGWHDGKYSGLGSSPRLNLLLVHVKESTYSVVCPHGPRSQMGRHPFVWHLPMCVTWVPRAQWESLSFPCRAPAIPLAALCWMSEGWERQPQWSSPWHYLFRLSKTLVQNDIRCLLFPTVPEGGGVPLSPSWCPGLS